MGYAELSMENLKLATKVQMLERESRHYRDRNEELNRQILILKDSNKQLTSGIDRYAEEKYRLTKDNSKLENEKRVLQSRISELEEGEGKSDTIFQKIGDALGLQGKIFEDWSFCSIFGVIEEMNASAVTDMVRVASMKLERQKLLTKLEAAEETRDEAIKKYSDLSERYDRAAEKLNEAYADGLTR